MGIYTFGVKAVIPIMRKPGKSFSWFNQRRAGRKNDFFGSIRAAQTAKMIFFLRAVPRNLELIGT